MLADLLRGAGGGGRRRDTDIKEEMQLSLLLSNIAGGAGCYLQQLRVLPAELLQQSWEQSGVPLDGLSHVQKLGLSSQERQRILT